MSKFKYKLVSPFNINGCNKVTVGPALINNKYTHHPFCVGMASTSLPLTAVRVTENDRVYGFALG